MRSPKGRFTVFRKEVSLALGAARNAAPGAGGHPFDVELARIPPGQTNWPFHAHSMQWELYIVLAGHGETRTPEGATPIAAGEAFVHPPGEAHQIRNTGAGDLVYYVVADQPPAETVHYPDSGKWIAKPPGTCFRMAEANYFDGEE